MQGRGREIQSMSNGQLLGPSKLDILKGVRPKITHA